MKKALLALVGLAVVAVIGALAVVKLGLLNPTLDELKAKYASAPSDEFIVIDNVPLHVRDEGVRDGALPPLILLNGHLGNLRMWDGWVPILAPAMRVIRFDVPPYGLSGPDPKGVYTSARAVELLEGLIAHYGFEKVNLGGTSNGALVAMLYSIKHPERVGKLVLSTVPNGRPPAREASAEMAKASRFRSVLMPYQTKEFYNAFLRDVFATPAPGPQEGRPPGADRVTPPLVDLYAEINNRRDAIGWVDSYIQSQYAFWDSTDVPALFAQVTTPTLLQWGDGGRVLPPAVGDTVRDLLKNAPLVMKRYGDAGHMPMLELPEPTANDAMAFLRND
ncbi:MAG: alpha/beta hydrolase [Rhodospirillaceae bacterium]|nr:alpha/beta hydrolase [Rhodospirillaceae bacterium]